MKRIFQNWLIILTLLAPLLMIDNADAGIRKICAETSSYRTRPADFQDLKMSCPERLRWLEDALIELGVSRQLLMWAAQEYSIPSHLLATVLANEISDMDICDAVQNHINTDYIPGFSNGSFGIAQLQTQRIIDHGLFKYSYYETVGNHRSAYLRLIEPKKAVYLAAAEIKWILNEMGHALEKGFVFPRYFITKRVPVLNTDPQAYYRATLVERQSWSKNPEWKQKESTLAYGVSMAYNNHNLIRDWSNKDGIPELAVVPNGHQHWRSMTHATNAESLWSGCIADQNWPQNTAPTTFEATPWNSENKTQERTDGDPWDDIIDGWNQPKEEIKPLSKAGMTCKRVADSLMGQTCDCIRVMENGEVRHLPNTWVIPPHKTCADIK